jgi:hypothetical protein
VQRLAADLQREFPGMAGFSPQNIWHMRSIYRDWTEDVAKLQQPVGSMTITCTLKPPSIEAAYYLHVAYWGMYNRTS